MATQLQLRRGTAAENAVFTGAQGELTMSTDTKALQIHDGSTTGGFMVDTVVAFQKPTAGNDYTWYRKYASGWVEQGGYVSITDAVMTINLPITMSNTNYCLVVFQERNIDGTSVPGITEKTTVSFSTNAQATANGSWHVEGMAA